MNGMEILQSMRTQILDIAHRHGVKSLRIFGSVARGEDNSSSDFDFLILEYGPEHTPWFPGGFIADLEDLLGRRVDVAFPDSLKSWMREQVMQESLPI
jgi:predicted nucleotidyltransferase